MTDGDDALALLPETFRYSEALEHVSERQLRRLITEGWLTSLARGLYKKADSLGDDDLTEVAARSAYATLCMRSALARHDLIDDIPSEIDVAILRGSWTPTTRAPVRWRHFDPDTFDIGRERLALGGDRSIGIYSAERSIIDAFRLKHIDGPDMANAALKQWLHRGGQPSTLLRMTKSFPRALPSLRGALEILL